MVDLETTFNSSYAYHELKCFFESQTAWIWKQGDSDVFGFHLNGKDAEGNEIKLFDLRTAENVSTPPDFLMEITAKDTATAVSIQEKFLKLVECN